MDGDQVDQVVITRSNHGSIMVGKVLQLAKAKGETVFPGFAARTDPCVSLSDRKGLGGGVRWWG